ELAAMGDFRLSSMNPVMEIGELEANRKSRWALNFEGEKGARIYFDLMRGNTGGWGVEKMKLPDQEVAGKAVFVDSLGITDAFLRAALEQNFDDAKSFVDPELVSDAKIAGLCIIFEEAKYKLRSQKPLRAMFNRDLTAGFIAHVEDESGEKAADFGLNVQRKGADQPWQVTEVNLDSLLADYADRVAGGDVHYTPLIKNPTGGDTLILYFGFDEDGLTPRTQRQLDIVAGLLKIDPDKKLTLSGHTDSLGTDQYNDELSGRRAGAVQKYLLGVGVPRQQIVAMAEGEAKPRRPNATADGEDNPSGRRANRRTEIYLDF
ncbi:OmpA family protein, partial [Akkermansiaceae bacterium]|nr:OmpA family protein [Akkermansiaceae bacterium]